MPIFILSLFCVQVSKNLTHLIVSVGANGCGTEVGQCASLCVRACACLCVCACVARRAVTVQTVVG